MKYRQVILNPIKQLLIFSICGLAAIVLLTVWERFNGQISVLSHDAFVDISIGLIQLNTVVVGLLAAFFFFWIQGLESKRQSNYLQFKNKVDKLMDFRMSLRPSLEYMEKPISKVIQMVSSTYKNNFPYQEYHLDVLRKSTKKITKQSQKGDDIEGEYVAIILTDLQFYASEIGMCFIELTIASFALTSIRKQIALIISLVAIVLITYFAVTVSSNVLIGILITVILLTLSSLLELYTHISDYYRELDESWHIYADKNNNA